MTRTTDDNPKRSAGASVDTSPRTLGPSTTFEWKRVRVNRGAAGRETARRSRSAWRRFVRRNPGDWLTIRVKWAGGAQDWCLVEARGETNPIPGHLALFDVVMMVNNAG